MLTKTYFKHFTLKKLSQRLMMECEHSPVDFEDAPHSKSHLNDANSDISFGKCVDSADSLDVSGNPNAMNTADWRWAADKGFWDPLLRRWNENVGGMKAYIAQRNQRRAARNARVHRKVQKGLNVTSDDKPRTSKSLGNLKPHLRLVEGDYRPDIHLPRMYEEVRTQSFDNDFANMSESRTFIRSRLVQAICTHWPLQICQRYLALGFQEISSWPSFLIFLLI
jgi:hypothetical protein